MADPTDQPSTQGPADRPFGCLYRHGFARVAVATPAVTVADPAANLEHHLALARQAHDKHAAVCLFPELGLTGYACDDLFHQTALLDAAEQALADLVAASAELMPMLLVGLPWRHGDAVYNVAAVVHGGEVLGLVPKTFLPNYREYYEKRYFATAGDLPLDAVAAFRHPELVARHPDAVPIGNHVAFAANDVPGLTLAIEVCEDFWAPIPPSTFAALAGATVLANLSASNATIGKADRRRDLAAAHSARTVSAYLFSAAGPGESTTDLAWDGQTLIHENGDLVVEGERFPDEPHLIVADIDLGRLAAERARLTTLRDAAAEFADRVDAMQTIGFTLGLPFHAVPLERDIERFPFVPHDKTEVDHRCHDAFHIQVQGLAQRLRAAKLDNLVIGVSGGLDSTHALVVAAKTMDRLGLPRTDIHAFSLPGFATSAGTRTNAHKLAESLGVTMREIDITAACEQMLTDLDHPYSKGHRTPETYDITFENVQAGQRTSVLFRLANHLNALVVGTGDLSELALGFCTYGVGDHMSHYAVNCSVPKTLIQHLIRWTATTEDFAAARDVLLDIVDTEFSPELVPAGEDGDGDKPSQRAEDIVGPYELQDFHLFYALRYGYAPSKIAYLAHHAWKDVDAGLWPPTLTDHDPRNQYDLATIKRWLRVFIQRYYGFAQFKRSAIPNGPKVSTGGSLSPRGDWRAPSDSSPAAWLADLDRVPDDPNA
ncbi:MAG: NAD(+) synthase [Planctomycetota bacterium]